MKTTIALKMADTITAKMLISTTDGDCSCSESDMCPLGEVGEMITNQLHHIGAWMAARGNEAASEIYKSAECSIDGGAATLHWTAAGALCTARVPYQSNQPLAAVGMAIMEALRGLEATLDDSEESTHWEEMPLE